MGGATAFAQTREIKGTVVDDAGVPVIGAVVLIEGTSYATTTDIDGLYALSVPQDATELKFTLIGMNDVLEAINGRSVIDVTMTYATTELDEVVVTAMGITKSEKSLSYNVQQMELEAISPTGSFVNSLNGKVAGVTINTSSSGVGGSSRIVMRGTKSLSNNNNALYVIDGIPVANVASDQPSGLYEGAGQTGDVFNSINPDDIESISVLSGPSAAALYGASAANGVVIITTKKGAAEKLTLNYSNTTEFSSAYIMPSFQNTYGATEEGSYQSWGSKLDSPSDYDPRRFFKTGLTESNSLNLSAGNEKNQFYASISATNASGIIRNNEVDKYNASIRNTTKMLKDKLTLDVSMTYSNIKEQNMISQGQYMNPVLPVYLFPAGDDFSRLQVYKRYNAERNLETQYWPYDNNMAMQNPFWITDAQKYNNDKHRFSGTAQLKYEIVKGISLSLRGKYDRNAETHERRFDAGTLKLFASDYGFFSRSSNVMTQKYAELLLNVNKYFGSENQVSWTAVAGSNIDHMDYESSYIGGNLASVANLFTYDNIARKDAQTRLTQNGYTKQNIAAFVNTQVGYGSFVYLDLTGRFDWASTFAASNNNPFFYYSAGLSGILTDAFPALKSSAFSYWKAWVSYSEVGNSPEAHLTIPTYSITDGNVTTKTRYPWVDLEPERTKSFEVGTNVHFLDGHLRFSATYYLSKTFNQFFTFTLPVSSKWSSIIANAGNVQNSGFELSLRFDHNFGDLYWETYATASRNKNVVTELVKEFNFPELGTYSVDKLEPSSKAGVKTVIYEGGSMGALYATSIKTDPVTGALIQNGTGGITVDNSDAGYIYVGDTNPDAMLSWGNNFRWKGINLSFLFNARLGGIVVSKTQAVMDYYGVSAATAEARDRGYVDLGGMQLKDVKSYYQTIGSDGTGTGAMSMYVYDATNIRLAELTLGYDFPVQKWCTWCKGLNLSLVAHNLLMIYSKAPFDPEMTSSVGTYDQGIDYFMQPSTRNIGFSLKLKF